MNHLYSKLLFVFLFLVSLQASSQTYTLNWGTSFSPAWNNGNVNKTASNIGQSGINCTVALTLSGGAYENALGGNSGSKTPTVSGSTFTVPGSTQRLQVTLNLANNSQYCDIKYTFTGPVQNVNFRIADIDKSSATSNSYYDKVTITGSTGTATVLPTLSKYTNTNSNFLSISSNTAQVNTTSGQAGNTESDAQDQNGTINVSFNGLAIRTFTVRYHNATGAQSDPAAQSIAIGNLTFGKPAAPVASDVMNTATVVNEAIAAPISALQASDDETIASYKVLSLPLATAGTLQYNTTGTTYAPVTTTTSLTPAQAASLKFLPVPGYVGPATFTFQATDNRGLTSNTANYSLTVSPQMLATLPVTLGTFSAVLQNNRVQIKWNTYEESNSHYFIVERSLDGKTWTSVDSVLAQGNSAAVTWYSSNDQFSDSVAHYRLRMVDLDESFKYSNAVVLVQKAAGSVRVFPNPFMSSLNVSLKSEVETAAVARLFSFEGRMVHQSNVQLHKGQNSFSLNNLSSLPSGTYVLKVVDSKGAVLVTEKVNH
ncbi:T9SS type A sorting domain-containing protein [Paraflavisolibacter sp. H34]|uniref:T9SS type A sorting domain-containing protein n=1 Tax=Huijunlia imazamoxiresistens TaxID=3127457 RepID=UPI0030193216